MRILPALAAAIVIAAPAAAQTGKPAPILTTPEAKDAWTHAVPEVARVTHVDLNLDVDFAGKTLSGVATLDVLAAAGAKEVVLDVDDLDVISVTCPKGKPLPFAIGPRDKELGSALTVQLEGNKQILIRYKTRPGASALQWLAPELTAGKRKPYLFSQGQPINNRSWIPTQDSPGIRQTWSATLTVPAGFVAVMSGDRLDGEKGQAAPDGKRRFRFRMDKPVPPYLVAMAVGDLAFKATGKRSGVWTEPSMLDAAAHEVGDVEKMIDAAQALYGPYRWGRYDMLVLPPSFPYGGMENPTLTFLTPTIITGDRSNTDVVAHELAHSWSGNLVTNASWKDIWLNEGFTTYVQGRITEALYGKEMAEMEKQIDQTDLLAEVKDMSPADQALALPPLNERDPDEALSQVAYVKGSWFLEFLEQRFGRETFDPFLRGWFNDHAFQSANTDQFVEYLKKNLLPKNPTAVTEAELKAWLDEPGIPAFAAKAQSRNFSSVDTARIAFASAGTVPSSQVIAEWSTQEWVRFIDGLGATQPLDKLATLDKAFHFTGTPNGEIAMRWYPLAIRSGYEQANEGAAAFIERVGRRKLIMPIYAELVKTPKGLELAKQAFEKAKPGYHPITTGSVQDMLSKAEAK